MLGWMGTTFKGKCTDWSVWIFWRKRSPALAVKPQSIPGNQQCQIIRCVLDVTKMVSQCVRHQFLLIDGQYPLPMLNTCAAMLSASGSNICFHSQLSANICTMSVMPLQCILQLQNAILLHHPLIVCEELRWMSTTHLPSCVHYVWPCHNLLHILHLYFFPGAPHKTHSCQTVLMVQRALRNFKYALIIVSFKISLGCMWYLGPGANVLIGNLNLKYQTLEHGNAVKELTTIYWYTNSST